MVSSAVNSFAVVVALAFCGQAIDYGINGDHWALEGFVEDIKREVGPNERVFMEDLSGRLALMSERTFVSGDGLVNSNKYLETYLNTGRIADYLAENHIEYFLTSNVQCYPYRKRMPWTRNVGDPVDISYLTRMEIKPSVLKLGEVVFDKCVNGFRELLFRVQ